jgi:hypothetical protein
LRFCRRGVYFCHTSLQRRAARPSFLPFSFADRLALAPASNRPDMPRKKKTEETISSATPAPEPRPTSTTEHNQSAEAPKIQGEALAEKTSAGRRRKAVALPSEGSAAETAASPAPPTSKKKASEPTAPTEDKPKGRGRKKVEALPSDLPDSPAPAAPEAAETPAPSPEEKKPVRRKKQAATGSALPASTTRPRQKAKPKQSVEAAAAPAQDPAVPEPIVEASELPDKIVLDLDEFATPLTLTFGFRPRQSAPLAERAAQGSEPDSSETEEVDETSISAVDATEAVSDDPLTPPALTFSLRPRAKQGGKPVRTPEPEPDEAPLGASMRPIAVTAKAEEETVALPLQVTPPPRNLADDEERDLLVALWRTAGTAPRPPVDGSAGEEDDEDGQSAGGFDQDGPQGRRRRRRRGKRDDRGAGPDETVLVSEQPEAASEPQGVASPVLSEPAAAPVAAAAPSSKTAPVKAPKPRIPVPLDAPQVVLRGGIPTLVIDRKVVPPLFFTVGEADGKAEAVVLEQAKMAAEQGVILFGCTVKLEPSEEGAAAAYHKVQSFCRLMAQATPDSLVLVRVEFIPIHVPSTRGWTPEPGHPSLTSDSYWSQANEALRELCRSLRDLPILGIQLERDSWHYGPDEVFEDSSDSRAKFGQWLRHRYRNDVVSLRASWFDGKVDFNRVEIPDFRNRHGSDTDFVRLDRRARRWVDYHLFLSDLVVERIFDLARTVKEETQARFLVGASYGYTFEWSHPGSGHLSLGKLLRCPEVDYVAGPPSYKEREPGSSGASPWPIDSFALSSKLALSEEDFRTSIGRGEDQHENPLMKTPQALEAAHWRGVGAVLAHGGGLNWMDRESQGWLGSRGIWERAKKVASALQWRAATPMKDPDIAVLIDERSLAYLADERAFTELVQDVRESVLRSGLSVGFYLLSDLAHRETFPEAKVHVFVNAWDIRPEVRSAIKARLQRDNKVLMWLYSAGLFEGGRESLVRAREVTGIALRPQPFNSRSGTSLLNVRDPLCRVLPDDAISQGGSLEPSYFAIPEDATVLGEYTQTGLPSFVVQKFPKQGTNDDPWTSIFLGEPVVSPGLFRALGQMAGAHVWSLDDDILHIRAPFLTLHCRGAGVRTLNLPDKWSCYDLIQGVWMPVENSNLKFLGLDGATHSFLVGHKSAIEAILSGAPASTLTEEEIKAHQDNTIQWDSIKFDVPIMKLDEWVEESWGDDLAEDLLIKPSMIDEIEETPEEDSPASAGPPQRSRSRRERDRTRKGKKGPGGGRPDPGQKAQEEVQTINFLFRKRE